MDRLVLEGGHRNRVRNRVNRGMQWAIIALLIVNLVLWGAALGIRHWSESIDKGGVYAAQG